MKITIKNKFIIFPVNRLVSKKKICLKRADETLYEINIRLDNLNPDYYAYINVSRYLGETLEIEVEPEMKLDFRFSDAMDIENIYCEPMRPQVHFTTKNGWINDPNGLCYLDGVFHMFYQHNPTEPNWDNMHWGHVVSRDLIHWEEKDIALYPDSRGTMFSGSAIVDNNNVLGFQENEKKTVALFYTLAGNPFRQNMAFSTDGFETIHEYENNPVLPCIIGGNRDPKVVFCDDLGCYIMALYLHEDVYALLSSSDLIKWEEIQRIRLEGDSECPDIFPIKDNKGNKKWILMGASDKYLVGEFKNGEFSSVQNTRSLHYGNASYAGQTFNNVPDGRVVQITWHKWDFPANFNFNSQMGIPTELSLSKHKDTYYLATNPVKEIEVLYHKNEKYENIKLSPKEKFKTALEDKAHLFRIKGSSGENEVVKIWAFGVNTVLDFAKNEIKTGDVTAPLSVTNQDMDITIIFDRCGVEIFSDGGKIYISGSGEKNLPDRNLSNFILESNKEYTVRSLEICPLNSIWNE